MRKTPIRHKVKSHTRKRGRVRVRAYMRGNGKPPTLTIKRRVKTRLPMDIERLKRIHERRTEHAQRVDEAIEAETKALIEEQWIKDPSRSDVAGVDYFPIPTKPGDFEVNARLIGYSLGEYYGKDLSDVKPVKTETTKEFSKLYGRPSSGVYAFASVPRNRVVFSPKASVLIEKGRLETWKDFTAMQAVAHEYGHIVTPSRKSFFRSAFDEGSNEILSYRYVAHNIQMSRNLRKRVIQNPIYAYWKEVSIVNKVSLLVNDGDRRNALRWIRDIRRSGYSKQKSMVSRAKRKLVKNGVPKEIAEDVFHMSAHNYPLGSKPHLHRVEGKLSDVILDKYPRKSSPNWWVK